MLSYLKAGYKDAYLRIQGGRALQKIKFKDNLRTIQGIFQDFKDTLRKFRVHYNKCNTRKYLKNNKISVSVQHM